MVNPNKEHIDEARALGAVCVNGRISTGHDKRSPYFNVLPSHRHLYADAASLAEGEPLPENIEVSCFDTLGEFNAEFFCKYARRMTSGKSPRDYMNGKQKQQGTFYPKQTARGNTSERLLLKHWPHEADE